MIKPGLAIALMGLAAPAGAREHLVRVPFVGCPADGQTGYIPPPKSGESPSLPPRLARELAYYGYENGPAVLAPRGWHCVGLYGSAGSHLIVTPERHQADEFFHHERPADLRGPAIQISVSYGGTSGRDEVAQGIARLFPAHRDFLRKVIKLDREIGYALDLPKASRTDIIGRRTATFVRFTTPAKHQGEGTHSRLLPGNLPIEGIRQLGDFGDGPDLLSVDVRLPASQAHLVEPILAEAE
jgi:hypothetical protein